MASLFRDFSFDAPPRRPAQDMAERDFMGTSPTSTTPSPFDFPSRLPTPPPCSVNDLATALNKQDLRVIIDPNYQPRSPWEPLTPPDDASFVHNLPEPPKLSLSTVRLNSATLRMQRQANVRLQSSATHVKDIASLVEKMIEVEDQCTVCTRKSKAPSPTPSLEQDEGVSMDYTPSAKEEMHSMLPFYRAGDRIDGSTRVTKRPRMRRSTCGRITKRSSR